MTISTKYRNTPMTTAATAFRIATSTVTAASPVDRLYPRVRVEHPVDHTDFQAV
jgi:hypothetical protein